MPARTIVLTFDYELFFGTPGTLGRTLLDPTAALLGALGRHGIRGSFFVDVLHYLRAAEEPDARQEAEAIAAQVRAIAEGGHDVELHLHPHWLDAVREGGSWRFASYDRYRLQSLPEAEVVALFTRGADALRELAGGGVRSFRAGGYCALPFAPLAEGFEAAGIVTDSSVAPGLRSRVGNQEYDYSEVTPAPAWRFSGDPRVPEADGRFCEVPITTYRRGRVTKAYRKLVTTLRPGDFVQAGDGTAMPGSAPAGSRLETTTAMFTLEALAPSTIVRLVEHADSQVLTFLTHPKFTSPSSLVALDRLVARGHRFATLAEVAAERCGAPAEGAAR